MRLPKALFFLLILCAACFSAEASHLSGGNVQLIPTGTTNQFMAQLVVYRDCQGIPAANTEDVNITSTCGLSTIATLDLISVVESDFLCTVQAPLSLCNGGTLPGYQGYTYQATITLPYCNGTYSVDWSTCCRNNIVSMANGNSLEMYLEFNYEMGNDSLNVPPTILPFTEWIACLGQPTTVAATAYDTDGDSLSYELVAPLTAGFYPVSFLPPYTDSLPIGGFMFDEQTGVASFTPAIQGNFIFAVDVLEWDQNDSLLSRTVRDFQITVMPCGNNAAPYDSVGVISNITGGYKTDNLALFVCEGIDYSMEAQYSDPDSGQVLMLTTNADSVFPGATVTIQNGNPATFSLEVLAGQAPMGTHFITVTAKDEHCPIQGSHTYVYTVEVGQAAAIYGDTLLCEGNGTQLTTTGGNNITWSVISGDPIVQGSNFVCTDTACTDVFVTPDSTTTYAILANGTVGCQSHDTITVHVGPQFTAGVGTQDLCRPTAVVSPTINPPGTYTYQWSAAGPNVNFLNPTAPEPTVEALMPGQESATVDITNAGGCVVTTTFWLVVDSFALYHPVVVGDTERCITNATAVLDVELQPVANGYPCNYTVHYTDGSGTMPRVSLQMDNNGFPTTGASSGPLVTFATAPWAVNAGDTLELHYSPGGAPSVASVTVLDNLLDTVFHYPQAPPSGIIFTGIAACQWEASSYSTAWESVDGNIFFTNGDSVNVVGPVGTTEYQYITNDPASGCSDTTRHFVHVSALDSATITTAPVQCLGDTVVLTSPDTGGSWSLLGQPLLNPWFNTTSYGIGSFQLLHETNGDCSGSDSIFVQIVDTVTRPLTTYQPVCAGEDLLLDATSNLPVLWFSDAGQTDTLGPNPVTVQGFADTTTFWAVAVGDGSCRSAAAPLEAAFVPAPVIDTITGQVTVAHGSIHSYTAISTTALTYNWVITNGGIINGQATATVEVNWFSTGEPSIDLYVLDANGCESEIYALQGGFYPTGVADVGPTSRLAVWPNPASEMVQVQLPAGVQNAREVRLYNVLGRLVAAQPVSGSGTVEFSVSGLVPGHYVVQVVGDAIATGRLVVTD